MNPLLQSFHIRSFRGLKNVSLENLGRINLLVGENNVGKTSILESLMVYCAPGSPRGWLRILNSRDVAITKDNVGETASWLFPIIGRDHLAERADIVLEGNTNEAEEGLKLQLAFESETVSRRRLAGRRYSEIPDDELSVRKVAHVNAQFYSSQEGDKSGELVFGSEKNRGSIHSLQPDIDAPVQRIRAYPLSFVKPHAHRVARFALGAVTNAVWAEQKDLLIQTVNIFDPDVHDVEMVQSDFEPELVLKHRKLGPMPLHAFGDGLRKAVTVTGQALRAKNGVLLLDEAETALHVHAQDRFFLGLHELCDQLNVQVFMTTHSLDSVDAILRASKHRAAEVVAYHLSNNDGVRSIKRSSEEFLARVRFQRGVDIR